MLRKIFLLVILFALSLSVEAYYPYTKVNLHNAKFTKKPRKVNEDWLKYIEDYPQALKAQGKPYRVDQYVSYNLAFTTNGDVDFQNIKLIKSRLNADYALKAIDYLKQIDYKIQVKDNSKPVKIEFLYRAF